MKIYPLMEALTFPGEVVTAECMVGRLIDRGYKHIPTAGSIARVLHRHPMFDVRVGIAKKRFYVRRHTRRRRRAR